MKKWLFMSLFVTAQLVGINDARATEHADAAIREISADDLLAWYCHKVPMTVLDARGKQYLNGVKLPGARWPSLRVCDDVIFALVPAKDSLVVVYCSNVECPASGWLAERLLELGYTNIYEYSGGIDEWLDRGFPTEILNP